MNDFKFDPKKLDETKANLAKAIEKFEEIKADYGGTGENVNINEFIDYHCAVMDALGYALKRLQQQMSYLSDSLYNHTSQGHLPPINSQAQMAGAIKALKLDDEYDVKKRVIYANKKGLPLVSIGKDVEI